MGIFRNFPYSNFHEMNMDEIIKIVKNMLEEWAQYYDTWDDWKTQVTNEWSAMQSFINHYFDNLNVQTEINNKITAMVNSGEFSQIVDPYVPPAVSSWLAQHITTPETVVIDDSLTIEGAAADAKATGNHIFPLYNILDLSTGHKNISNGYLSGADGEFVANASWRSSDFIPIEVGNIIAHIYASDMSNSSTMKNIWLYDSNYQAVKAEYRHITTGTYIYRLINVPENAKYLRFCIAQLDYNDNPDFSIFVAVQENANKQTKAITTDEIGNVDISANYKTLENGYIRNGAFVASDSYRCTDYIPVNMPYIHAVVWASDFSGGTGFYNIWAYDKDKNSLAGVYRHTTTSEVLDTILTLPANTAYIRYCVNNSQYQSYGKFNFYYPYNKSIEALANETQKEIMSVSLFENIAVIGDSFSSGAVFGVTGVSDGMHDNFAWIRIMAKNNGVNDFIYAISGIDTYEWVTEPIDGAHRAYYATRGKTALLNATPHNLYFNMLGINDQTINGSTDDCDLSDYRNNANTWYGNYGKVLGIVKEHAPNAKIVCVIPPVTTTEKTNAIKDVADFYSVPYIETLEDEYFTSAFYKGNMSTSHPVAITYAGMAKAIERLFIKCVVENSSYFFDYNGLTTN